jgi:hypothetical protein
MLLSTQSAFLPRHPHHDTTRPGLQTDRWTDKFLSHHTRLGMKEIEKDLLDLGGA